jgi:hypothetical protein
MSQFLRVGSGVAGAAADARKTSGATGYAARPCVLTTGPTADTRDATLTAGTTTGTAELTTGPAVAVGVTATAARVLLVDRVRGASAGCTHTRFGCRHRHYSHRCGNRPTNNKRFQHTDYGHVNFFTPSTRVQNIEFQS